MKPDIEELRKKYIENPPEGMTSEDIRHMSEDDLLDMDYFLNEDDPFDDLFGERVFILLSGKIGISYKEKNRSRVIFTSTPILFLLFSRHVRLEDFTLFYTCRKFYHLGTLLGQCLTAIAARISTKHPQILHIPFNKFVHSPHFFNLRSYSELETLSSSGRLEI